MSIPASAPGPLRPSHIFVFLGVTFLLGTGCSSFQGTGETGRVSPGALRKSLTFHASFDRSTDADYALGDPWVYHAPTMARMREAQPGLPGRGAAVLDPTGGRHAGALRFDRPAEPVVFFRADRNLPWRKEDWSGTVMFWLRVDSATLAPGYADPVNITPKAWDDAAFFVEFEKRTNDVPFRLGAYADKKVWNPLGRNWNQMSAAEKPLVTVPGPPFSGTRWTHVAFTWERFNTGKPEGTTLLYLDGAQVGAIRGRTQTFTWDPAEARIHLGIGFVGSIDDLAVFDRALSMPEIQQVRTAPGGVRDLYSRR